MANKKQLKLTISRVDGAVFDGEVTSVSVPGIAGDMEIFADHTALISPLRAGTIKVNKNDDGAEAETHTIESGTLEISNNHATILI